jgi:hypothetical protein
MIDHCARSDQPAVLGRSVINDRRDVALGVDPTHPGAKTRLASLPGMGFANFVKNPKVWIFASTKPDQGEK